MGDGGGGGALSPPLLQQYNGNRQELESLSLLSPITPSRSEEQTARARRVRGGSETPTARPAGARPLPREGLPRRTPAREREGERERGGEREGERTSRPPPAPARRVPSGPAAGEEGLLTCRAWSNRVVKPSGQTEWSNRVVKRSGQTEWSNRVVKPSGQPKQLDGPNQLSSSRRGSNKQSNAAMAEMMTQDFRPARRRIWRFGRRRGMPRFARRG